MTRSARGALLLALGALVIAVIVAPASGTFGAFTAKVTNTVNTIATKPQFVCADTFASDSRKSNAFFEWALTDAAGSTAVTGSSNAGNPGTYRGTSPSARDTASPMACPNDAGGAYALNGTDNYATSTVAYPTTAKPTVTTNVSLEVWFKTSTAAGKLLGFENAQTGAGSGYDKQFYIGSNGLLYYGIHGSGQKLLASPSVVTDGRWHQAVATTSSTAGSVLYIDGVAVASDSSMTLAQNFTGYWRIGYGNLTNWLNAPSSFWFKGSLRFVAAYAAVFSAAEVAADYSVGVPA